MAGSGVMRIVLAEIQDKAKKGPSDDMAALEAALMAEQASGKK